MLTDASDFEAEPGIELHEGSRGKQKQNKQVGRGLKGRYGHLPSAALPRCPVLCGSGADAAACLRKVPEPWASEWHA